MTKEELGEHWTKHRPKLIAHAAERLRIYDVAYDDQELPAELVQDTLAGILDTKKKCYKAWAVRPGISIAAPFKEAVDYRCREYRDEVSRHVRLTTKEWERGEVKWKPRGQDKDDKEDTEPVINAYPDFSTSPEKVDRIIDVQEAIDSLDPDDREIMLMYYFDGMTEQEIADEKNWTHRKVEMARRRSLKLLEVPLEAYGEGRRFSVDTLKSEQAS